MPLWATSPTRKKPAPAFNRKVAIGIGAVRARRNSSIQALHISTPLVVAFHLFRVVVVNMGTQHIFVGVSRLLARAPTDGEPTASRES